MISDNIKSVRRRIEESCHKLNRPNGDVELVVVTKEASCDEIGEALVSGTHAIGENRVQDALAKYAVIGEKAAWHLVGHLQTNKVKDAVRIFSLIHSVDSARVAASIDKESARINKIQDILIQVNTSGEQSKFGIKPAAAEAFIKEVSLYHNISIKGLMTIAPEAGDCETIRPYFRALRELRDRLNTILNTQYTILSMGMSDDFEVAIEEGSTMVRIGRAIFRSVKCKAKSAKLDD